MKAQDKKRTAVFYVRIKESSKEWLFSKMKEDGWESMSAWFDHYIEKLKERRGSKR